VKMLVVALVGLARPSVCRECCESIKAKVSVVSQACRVGIMVGIVML